MISSPVDDAVIYLYRDQKETMYHPGRRAKNYLYWQRAGNEPRILRYIIDTLLALISTLSVISVIYFLQLYPKIPNISFLSLLIVLGLAITRGRYSAICGSIIAFFAFDFLLVPPLYQFTINSQDEWFALTVFLITAVITGQLASAFKQRAEDASQRENETRALYQLLSETTREVHLERQLYIVVRSIVKHFAFAGIRDCAILLPDQKQGLHIAADAACDYKQMQLSIDEQKTAASVMVQGQIMDFYSEMIPVPNENYHKTWFRREVHDDEKRRQYIRLIPLRVGERCIGLMRLLMEDKQQRFMLERNQPAGRAELSPRAAFFWAFLEQAAIIIDRARLRRETMEMELLRRTDTLRSALLSSVSHDLRTPLSAIKAAASSLLQEDVQWSEDERRSFAMAIEREADRLNRLVGNLLDMSRIEGGALRPEKEWFPIDEVLHDVLSRMQLVLDDRHVNIQIPDDLPPVALDYLQIDQVVTNVLENAVRYTPPASPIDILAERVNNDIQVSIADRGPGIPPADLEHVFDKFYRVTGTARKIGSGLGLAVCRGLIEAHGGHIWAENRPGGGAVFRFTLPLGEDEKASV